MSKLRGILKDPEIDAVFVLLPHNLHEQVCFEATQAGKHVPAGKPIACTLEEADNMIQARQKAGVTLMVAYDQRFEPVHKRIREPLDQNAIGEIMCNWGVYRARLGEGLSLFGQDGSLYLKDQKMLLVVNPYKEEFGPDTVEVKLTGTMTTCGPLRQMH